MEEKIEHHFFAPYSHTLHHATRTSYASFIGISQGEYEAGYVRTACVNQSIIYRGACHSIFDANRKELTRTMYSAPHYQIISLIINNMIFLEIAGMCLRRRAASDLTLSKDFPPCAHMPLAIEIDTSLRQ